MPGITSPCVGRKRLERQVTADGNCAEGKQMNAGHGLGDLVAAVAPAVGDETEASGILVECSVVSRHDNSFFLSFRIPRGTRFSVAMSMFGEHCNKMHARFNSI